MPLVSSNTCSYSFPISSADVDDRLEPLSSSRDVARAESGLRSRRDRIELKFLGDETISDKGWLALLFSKAVFGFC